MKEIKEKFKINTRFFNNLSENKKQAIIDFLRLDKELLEPVFGHMEGVPIKIKKDIKKRLVPIFVNPDDYLMSKVYLAKWYFPVIIYGKSSLTENALAINFLPTLIKERFEDGTVHFLQALPSTLSIIKNYIDISKMNDFQKTIFFLARKILCIGLPKKFRATYFNHYKVSAWEKTFEKFLRCLLKVRKIKEITIDEGFNYLAKYCKNLFKNKKITPALLKIPNCYRVLPNNLVITEKFSYIKNLAIEKGYNIDESDDAIHFKNEHIYFTDSMKEYCNEIFLVRESFFEYSKISFHTFYNHAYYWIPEWFKGVVVNLETLESEINSIIQQDSTMEYINTQEIIKELLRG